MDAVHRRILFGLLSRLGVLTLKQFGVVGAVGLVDGHDRGSAGLSKACGFFRQWWWWRSGCGGFDEALIVEFGKRLLSGAIWFDQTISLEVAAHLFLGTDDP